RKSVLYRGDAAGAVRGRCVGAGRRGKGDATPRATGTAPDSAGNVGGTNRSATDSAEGTTADAGGARPPVRAATDRARDFCRGYESRADAGGFAGGRVYL